METDKSSRQTSGPTIVLVVINSYLDRQADDFERKGPGTNTGLVTLLVEKMAAIKYICIRLLLNGRKCQLSKDLVLFKRPLTSKYLLLDQSNSVAPGLAAWLLLVLPTVTRRQAQEAPMNKEASCGGSGLCLCERHLVLSLSFLNSRTLSSHHIDFPKTITPFASSTPFRENCYVYRDATICSSGVNLSRILDNLFV